MTIGGRRSTLDTPWNILKYHIARVILARTGTITMVFAIMSVILIVYLTNKENWGTFLMLFGLSLSSVAAITMAIPSIPMFYERTMRYKFIDNLHPAFRSLNQGEVVEKGDDGFGEALYAFEVLTESTFDEPNKIIPKGYNFITKVEIDGKEYDVNPLELNDLRKRLEEHVEIMYHESGAKILFVGFLVQVIGTLISNNMIL